MQDAAPSPGVADLLAEFLSETQRLAVAGAVVVPEGVRINDDLVAATDLTTQLRNAVTSAGAVPRQERLREFLEQCLVIIRKAPKPTAKALLLLVSTVFLMICEAEVQESWLGSATRQALMAKIRKVTRVKASQTRLASRAMDLRVVMAERTLNVRRYPRTSDSRILGTLELGDAVVALRCVRDWTLVKYTDGDAVVTGWVYTRYVRKVVLPPTDQAPPCT